MADCSLRFLSSTAFCRRPALVCLAFMALVQLGPIGCGRGSSESDSTPNEPPHRDRATSLPSAEQVAAVPDAAVRQAVQAEPKLSPSNELARGFLHRHERVRSMPWSIHVLQIDRSRADLALVTTLSQDRVLGLGPLSEQIRTIPSELGRPLAAINGSFYCTEREVYAGDPRGLQILRGELASGPDAAVCFWIDPKGEPRIDQVVPQFKATLASGERFAFGLNEERPANAAVLYTPKLGSSTGTYGGRELILERDRENDWLPLRPGQTFTARVREVRGTGNSRLNSEIMVLSIGPSLVARLPAVTPGSIIKISTATSPDLTGVQTAIGGGPRLLRGRQPQPAHEHQGYSRHPRSAIGWNSKFIFLVIVDGRQRGLSIGMTLQELTDYFLKLGCDEAMNLDGGGSVEMWIEGDVVSSPCYGYERPTANGLVLLQKTKP